MRVLVLGHARAPQQRSGCWFDSCWNLSLVQKHGFMLQPGRWGGGLRGGGFGSVRGGAPPSAGTSAAGSGQIINRAGSDSGAETEQDPRKMIRLCVFGPPNPEEVRNRPRPGSGYEKSRREELTRLYQQKQARAQFCNRRLFGITQTADQLSSSDRPGRSRSRWPLDRDRPGRCELVNFDPARVRTRFGTPVLNQLTRTPKLFRQVHNASTTQSGSFRFRTGWTHIQSSLQNPPGPPGQVHAFGTPRVRPRNSNFLQGCVKTFQSSALHTN